MVNNMLWEIALKFDWQNQSYCIRTYQNNTDEYLHNMGFLIFIEVHVWIDPTNISDEKDGEKEKGPPSFGDEDIDVDMISVDLLNFIK